MHSALLCVKTIMHGYLSSDTFVDAPFLAIALVRDAGRYLRTIIGPDMIISPQQPWRYQCDKLRIRVVQSV